ncbi:hypothetical protein [Alteromonas sp. BMJM2]|uniref:hypothetical protein n=1 Tax=Alteromonas sp. BMJM2 TaxID=2954241 RepID=UPI0022B2D4DA|nr:hypothetical protein [Alteromonas sp. BMJM2]
MTDDEFSKISVFVHDARKPLNRISMQAELVKMALNGDIPAQKAAEALDKIIASAKDCSNTLAEMTTQMSASNSDSSDD